MMDVASRRESGKVAFYVKEANRHRSDRPPVAGRRYGQNRCPRTAGRPTPPRSPIDNAGAPRGNATTRDPANATGGSGQTLPASVSIAIAGSDVAIAGSRQRRPGGSLLHGCRRRASNPCKRFLKSVAGWILACQFQYARRPKPANHGPFWAAEVRYLDIGRST